MSPNMIITSILSDLTFPGFILMKLKPPSGKQKSWIKDICLLTWKQLDNSCYFCSFYSCHHYVPVIISLNLYKPFLFSFHYLFTLEVNSNHNLGATYNIFLFLGRYGIYFNMEHFKLSKAQCSGLKITQANFRGWGMTDFKTSKHLKSIFILKTSVSG